MTFNKHIVGSANFYPVKQISSDFAGFGIVLFAGFGSKHNYKTFIRKDFINDEVGTYNFFCRLVLRHYKAVSIRNGWDKSGPEK